MKRLLIGSMLVSMTLSGPLAAASGPSGLWLDEAGRAAIDIEPCGQKLCGTVAWLKQPLDDHGAPRTDIHNPDASLQGRKLCGLPLLSGFSPDGADAWSGGTIYDPRSGKTYKCNMRLNTDGTLVVRGYVGISLFGQSQTWTRPAAPLARCM